ncbi:MAG TPA: MarR family transcriptional regulator [Vicinamibacterales bacterium]|nr:MarR family transcriptional regulator [Vicinamibacterales bacterium]
MPAKPDPTSPARRRTRSARTTAQFEVFSALVVAAEQFERELVALLREDELSVSQYNILRILRGAGPLGLACGQVAGQLFRHDPDVTRLMDRLEKRGLIERTREVQDRRVVRTRITPPGLELLDGLDAPVDHLHERQLGHMSERQLSSLKTLLTEARTREE